MPSDPTRMEASTQSQDEAFIGSHLIFGLVCLQCIYRQDRVPVCFQIIRHEAHLTK
jgi:hypothetical protein